MDILADEMIVWQASLNKIDRNLDIDNFCVALTESLMTQNRLLKLYSILFTILEPGSGLEAIVEFKKTAINTSKVLENLIFEIIKDANKSQIISAEIVCFVLGLYPMCNLSEIQIKALDVLDADYVVSDFKTICVDGIRKFFS